MMKVIKTVLFCLASLLLVALSTNSAQALSASRKKEYGYSGIYFYDPDWVAKADCIDLSVSLVGNDNVEKAWNFFASAGIPGISDDPAVIAGIVGNLLTESNLNPFIENSSSGAIGIYQAIGGRKTSLLDDLSSHGVTWGDESQADAALQIELAHLVNEAEYGEPGFEEFKNNLGQVANKTAEAYAELFLVIVERAVGGSDPILDPGVSSYWRVSGGYQGTTSRRSNAAAVYEKLASSSPASMSDDTDGPGSSSSSTSSSSCYSASGNSNIAQTAIDLAWEEDHITAAMERTEAAFQAKPAYTHALEETGVGAFLGRGTPEGRGASCDVFVATVMHYSGLDTGFPETGPNVQEHHMMNSSNYQRIHEAENGNYSALQPGDILVNTTEMGSSTDHIYIYVEINGQPKIAEAGYRRVTGEICYFYTYPNYHVYRYVGGK